SRHPRPAGPLSGCRDLLKTAPRVFEPLQSRLEGRLVEFRSQRRSSEIEIQVLHDCEPVLTVHRQLRPVTAHLPAEPIGRAEQSVKVPPQPPDSPRAGAIMGLHGLAPFSLDVPSISTPPRVSPSWECHETPFT